MGAPVAGGRPPGIFPGALAQTRSPTVTVPRHPRLCMPVLPHQSGVPAANPPVLSPPVIHHRPHHCHHCMPICWSRRGARRGLECPRLTRICNAASLTSLIFHLLLHKRAMALTPAGLGRSPSARQEVKPPSSVPAHPQWRKGRTSLGRRRRLGIA